MPTVSLKNISQLDVQLEINVPCPLWRVSSQFRDEDDDYDPVASAQEISHITSNKAVAKAERVNKFRKLTAKRNLAAHRSKIAADKKRQEVVVSAHTVAGPTVFQQHLIQVCDLNIPFFPRYFLYFLCHIYSLLNVGGKEHTVSCSKVQ